MGSVPPSVEFLCLSPIQSEPTDLMVNWDMNICDVHFQDEVALDLEGLFLSSSTKDLANDGVSLSSSIVTDDAVSTTTWSIPGSYGLNGINGCDDNGVDANGVDTTVELPNNSTGKHRATASNQIVAVAVSLYKLCSPSNHAAVAQVSTDTSSSLSAKNISKSFHWIMDQYFSLPIIRGLLLACSMWLIQPNRKALCPYWKFNWQLW